MNLGIRSAFKLLTEIRFPRQSMMLFGAPRATERDIERDVGDGTAANVVMTPIRWLQRSFQEAPPALRNNSGELNRDGDVIKLLDRPNKFYSGDHLFAATILSLAVDGNAYWQIVSNGRGKPIELWYTPHTTMEPKFPESGLEFISHYEYNVGGRKMDLPVEDVIHFRDGLDPANIRLGLSPLKALMREVWTDMECSMMVSSLLKNGGVPGVVISPDSDEVVDPNDADATKEMFKAKFGREKRGEPIVMTGKTKVEQFGWSPKDMDLSSIRNISEERVCAALGVPAAVVGFGTGIQQTKVGATLKELIRVGWFNGVVPIQRLIGAECTIKLVPKFGANIGEVTFDNTDVIAMREDENERAERIANLVFKGVWTRGEGRAATGQEVTPADDVFMVPINIVTVPRADISRGTPDNAPEQRARGVKQISPTEARIIENAPRLESTPAQLRSLAARTDRIVDQLAPVMADELEAYFLELGEAAYDAALPVLAKQAIETEQILEGMAMAERLPIFAQILERAALRVNNEVDEAITETLGLEANAPDVQARSVIAASGRRAGLVDLNTQTRRAIFDELTRGRAEGVAGENLARRIRDRVPAGPWSSPKVRARVIARTETTFARNVSTIERAKDAQIERVLVFDNRIGFNDEECSALDQLVVTLDEARQLMFDEHPNGTRSFTPLSEGFFTPI